jgi:site-specific DNA-methyltransferase (adenine-specific)
MKPYYKNELTTIYNGDCLEVMDYLIEQGVKFDAVITDPPYAVTDEEWDNIIPYNKLWERLKKLRKYNSSNIIMFSQDPFSIHLKQSNLREYKYSLIWDKQRVGQGLFKYSQPLRQYEEVNIFYNLFQGDNNDYRNIIKKINKRMNINNINLNDINNKFGTANNGGGVASSILGLKKQDLQIASSKYIKHLQELNLITDTEINEIKKLDVKPTYNALNKNGNYKSNIIKFPKVTSEAIHPTQKPVELLQYIIETYTKENDLILDFTAGSFTTCVAAEQLKRRSIGIELEKKYCDIGIKRLNNLQLKFDI